MHADCPKVVGPDTPLAKVFAFFESDGYSDPAAAWHTFTGTWNWAAPLTTAVSRTELPGPVARSAPGGFTLSGPWRLPSHEATGSWLALPLAAAIRGGPDLFVVPSGVLPGADRGFPAAGDALGPVFRLEDVHVPAGFVTHTAGAPLRAGDAAFLWTAVTALALGAARRVTDVLAGPSAGMVPRRPATSAVTAAELAAVLHDERLSLAAALHGAPSVRQGVAPSIEERLVAHVGQAANAVHHVVAAAYEHVLTSDRGGDDHPLVKVIEETSPILQQVRYAMELLPHDDRTSQKGRTR